MAERKLWVSESFATGGEIYIMSASYQEGIEHVRAAMVLDPKPLIVYESTKGEALIKHLKEDLKIDVEPRHLFVTSLTFDELSGSQKPGSNEALVQRVFSVLNESDQDKDKVYKSSLASMAYSRDNILSLDSTNP